MKEEKARKTQKVQCSRDALGTKHTVLSGRASLDQRIKEG